MLPLEGITVVSLEQAVAAPFATRQLADLGARVIKVERPEGDFARKYDSKVKGMSSIFVWLNRSKESIVLDLKQEEGKKALSKLLEKADVFVHNLAPGAVDRLGFGQEILEKNHPQLISCSISGYGNDGPYKDKKAYDMLIQGEAGLMSITGTKDTPSRAGISIADIAAGMYAYTGVLTALIQRSKTSKGVTLEISMLEALSEWMSYPLLYTAYGETELQRTGSSHAGIYPYGIFELSEGPAVFLAIQNDREWNRFCENVLKDEGVKADSRFATNSDRVANSTELRKLIEREFDEIGFEEVMTRLNDSGIANGEMKNIEAVLEHPQLHHRNRWRETESPVGLIQTLIPPVTSAEISFKMTSVPELGEHTEAILRELGMNVEQVKV
ncbi:CaiB/BaiF CoA-transferase family protein [Planomicrobium sp. YIM 101495]|uniref:CaiB/BaiF CoA transferase family protein n=1 Tax=Planomicrobium sp. YIM 101495 TaxID=2665160 RepID=UPI0012BA112C|nr:CaiB/BaiF CoA-transferase family protein [Planomicrobium sp. YIM 101495]MTD30588.1 CoA transferase [Planomicrobium sp. YIM 101495]